MADDTKGAGKRTADTADAADSGAPSFAPSSGASSERGDEHPAGASTRATKTTGAPVGAPAETHGRPGPESVDGATGATPGAPPAAATMRAVITPRRARVVIKKIGPWSVFKFSLLFYFFVMIVFLLALTILYLLMNALGTLDSAVKLLTEFGVFDSGFRIDGGWLFFRAFTAGLVLVVLWSTINVFATFLYNLISDIVGGIELTLAEKR